MKPSAIYRERRHKKICQMLRNSDRFVLTSGTDVCNLKIGGTAKNLNRTFRKLLEQIQIAAWPHLPQVRCGRKAFISLSSILLSQPQTPILNSPFFFPKKCSD